MITQRLTAAYVAPAVNGFRAGAVLRRAMMSVSDAPQEVVLFSSSFAFWHLLEKSLQSLSVVSSEIRC